METLVTEVSKEGSGSQGMVNNQAPTSSRSENVVQANIALDQSGEIPHLTNEALSQLKNNKIQAKVSPFYFAVVLLNELIKYKGDESGEKCLRDCTETSTE